MDRGRAQQIVSSIEMVDVTYNGDLVYLEQVNPTKDTVSIHPLNQPQNSREVDITQLSEPK